jgi:hypothetical protein
MSNRAQIGMLNLTREPKSNNSNLYFNNSINYQPIKNSLSQNVLITSFDPFQKKKFLDQIPPEILAVLSNNKNNLKNHLIFGTNFKFLLIKEEQYDEKGIYTGAAKIWLAYIEKIGMFDYVIEIVPSKNSAGYSIKKIKTIIPFLINSIDISLIIKALKKFGAKNIDEEKARKEYNNFKWSFSIGSIPRISSAFKKFESKTQNFIKKQTSINREVQLLTGNNRLQQKIFKPIQNNSNSNNNNSPALPLNNNI